MCGIVGIIGRDMVANRIVNSLEKLEYRGYDSAGIAVLDDRSIDVRKVAGRICNLRDEMAKHPIDGLVGIGHTRWATHGAPTAQNAHPFKYEDVALVHNGIIENYIELKERLKKEGYKFQSQTDTEVIVCLIHYYMKQENLTELDAVMAAVKELEGAYAIGVMFAKNPDLLIGAKKGAPLAIGKGDGEMYLGSDALALSLFTSNISYLDDEEIAILNRETFKVIDFAGNNIKKTFKKLATSEKDVGKGNYSHFMLREMSEQPEILNQVLAHYFNPIKRELKFKINFTRIKRIYIIACGTSFNAAMTAKYWFEELANIPVEIDIASEYRYRSNIFEKGSVAIFISQSGETADTLAALKHSHESGVKIIGLVNAEESSIANAADFVLPIKAGFEIGVASTKAFTAQLTILALLAIHAGRQKEIISEEEFVIKLSQFHALPDMLKQVLMMSDQIKKIAQKIASAKSMLYVGRGTSYPIAIEGALKIKELAYIHAEGLAAGELKHGPIALIDEDMPIVVIAPYDRLFAKTASNISEINSRKGKIFAFTDKNGALEIDKLAHCILELPECSSLISPIIYTIPMQLLAYHTANILGKDVDKPRNLAKSVTVE